MSSPAQNSEEGAAVKPVSRNTRAARKSTGPNVLTAAGDGEVNGQTNHPAADESLPPSAREAAQSSTPQLTGPRSRRKAFHYIETEEEQDEGSEDLESAVDVASTRRSARAKAAASNAAKGKGRARRIADPEQATSRVSLPTRKGRTGVEAARESSQISESDARREEVNGDEENELELDISARRLAQESQDEDIDELASSEPVQEDSNDSAPVASTSAAVHALPARRRTSRRSAASAAPSTSSSAPSRPSAPKASTSATKGKGKGKAIATSAAPSSPALPVASGDVAEDDTLNNDPEQLAEKRRLFAEAIKAHREGLEQSERFLEIKRRYNEISLIYPRYVDERASAVTTWDGSERKTFLVALDLMPNPLANRRFKSVLMDHGINGVVTRNLKNRKSSQLKGECRVLFLACMS